MAIIPQGISTAARRIWLLGLLAAPLALAAGLWLQYRVAEEQDFRFTVDYGESIALCQSLALEKGLDTSGWKTFSAAQGEQDMHVYYRLGQEPWREALRRAVPEARIRVLQSRSDEEGEVAIFDCFLTPQGDRLGYRIQLPSEVPDTDLEADRAVALGAFQERGPDHLAADWTALEPATVRREGRAFRRFVWEASPEQAPEMTLQAAVEVRGGQVVAETLEASLDEEFVEAHLQSYGVSRAVAWVIYWLLVVFFTVYGAVRYARRSQQKEVAHARALTVAAIIALCYVAIVVLNIYDTIGQSVAGAPWWVLGLAMAVTGISYGLLGLIVGGAWAAGEGDVRELFEGKMISLDALVTGRIFCRNVARSYIWGIAWGAWLLAAAASLQVLFLDSPQLGESAEHMVTLFFTRLPWLFTFVSPLVSAFPLIITALLLPLSVSLRRSWPRRVRLLLLAVTAYLGSLFLGLLVFPLPVGLGVTLLLALAVHFLFRSGDLLTATIAVAAYSFLRSLVIIGSGTDFTAGVALVSGGLLTVTVAVQFYFAFRGRAVSQEEVRPLYARHARQRRSMQAEKEAAREAQLALAPRTTPSLPGVEVAAACKPARTVGGDFYDFFSGNDDRLGVLLAEGGGRGLSSALSIAYAKGLLLPLREQDLSAAEVLKRVLPELHPYLGESGMGILYGVVDSVLGRFEYARYGQYPRLLRCRSSSSLEVPESLFSVDLPGERSSATVRHGEFDLRPGEKIFCFTDGIAEILEASQSGAAEEWIRDFLLSRSDEGALKVQEAFLQALKPKVRKAKMSGVEDDLSSVILHFRELQQKGARTYGEEEVA
ncbi:MAG TPA: SpoIIE family protein phosphatase [Acidobacteriota bacterium]|nr:SpoIIE family protein phosphatase [Acidobacteriota bacterium]